MKKKSIYILLISILFINTTHSIARRVMTWVPVYGTTVTKSYINDPVKSEWLKNGITNIGLQFWVPGDNGAVNFLSDYQYTYKASTIAQDVQDYVTWGNANNVKIMLCLHNIREADFDWDYTKIVIDEYPNETVASIMTIINTYNLDGVDIDFEGVGSYGADKPAFVSFLDTLGRALRANGKELSVDMFSTPCYNYPNPSWESAMAPHVDFMTNMGYGDLYEDNNTLFAYCPATPSAANSYAYKYSFIEDYATNTQGIASSQLHFGIPGWETIWGGKTFHEHLLDIIDISEAGGISLWDLRLSAGGLWLEAETWEAIAMFKNDSTSEQIRANVLLTTEVNDIAEIRTAAPISFDFYSQSIKLAEPGGNLYLYSITGKLEKTWQSISTTTIPLYGIAAGIYLVKYETEKGLFNIKIDLATTQK